MNSYRVTYSDGKETTSTTIDAPTKSVAVLIWMTWCFFSWRIISVEEVA